MKLPILNKLETRLAIKQHVASIKSLKSHPMQLLTIANKSGKVRLNDSVNPASINRLIDELAKVFGLKAATNGLVTGDITNCIENAADTLEIEINSPGGSVMDGHRLYHAILAMRQRGVHVTATINSMAASMASVIAMAADVIHMTTGGRIMIHEASQSLHGTAADHARAAKLLEEISGEIADIYAARTRQPLVKIRQMMKDEAWMGAVEAKKLGFIDGIVSGGKVTNNSMTSPTTQPATAELDRLKAEVSTLKANAAALPAAPSNDILAQFEALPDGGSKVAFFQANKIELKAADHARTLTGNAARKAQSVAELKNRFPKKNK